MKMYQRLKNKKAASENFKLDNLTPEELKTDRMIADLCLI